MLVFYIVQCICILFSTKTSNKCFCLRDVFFLRTNKNARNAPQPRPSWGTSTLSQSSSFIFISFYIKITIKPMFCNKIIKSCINSRILVGHLFCAQRPAYFASQSGNSSGLVGSMMSCVRAQQL